MKYKRLIPCIFIENGKAVKWFHDSEVVSEDPVALAKHYSDGGADELIVFDLSDTDEDHEEAVALMKQMNLVIQMPMVAGGNIRRYEDVKKILYTGAKRVILNFSKPEMVSMIREVSERFGKEKIAVSLNDFDALFKKQELIEEYSSELIFMHRLDLNSVMNITNIQCVIVTDTMEESELLKILKCPGVKGLSGKFVNSTALDFRSFKERCTSENISMAEHTAESSSYRTGEQNSVRPHTVESHGEKSTVHILQEMYELTAERRKNPKDGSYTTYLLDCGLDKILQKLGEEVTEIIIASKNPNPEELKYELADFLYHAIVLMVEKGITWEDIADELAKR